MGFYSKGKLLVLIGIIKLGDELIQGTLNEGMAHYA
jgi:hypothetical protein